MIFGSTRPPPKAGELGQLPHGWKQFLNLMDRDRHGRPRIDSEVTRLIGLHFADLVTSPPNCILKMVRVGVPDQGPLPRTRFAGPDSTNLGEVTMSNCRSYTTNAVRINVKSIV